ncbi:unnamed protein product [Ilex paraguariensis]|uniref:Uncharacterized protein n=1 Tax=Ilex paraguariensis TaxID=185542 RepID=A0ABC8RI19_9AQUA
MATISHLLLHTSQNHSKNPNSSKTPKLDLRKTLSKPIIISSSVPPTISRRNLLIFSLPFSLTFQFRSWCSALTIFDPVSPAERDASAAVSRKVAEAVELLQRARELQAQGDFNQALEYFTQVSI